MKRFITVLSVIAIFVSGCQSDRGMTAVEGGNGRVFIVPKGNFFDDQAAGQQLEANLKATAGELAEAANVGAEAGFKDTTTIYKDVFNEYVQSLRIAYQGNYNKYMAALSQAEDQEERASLSASFDNLTDAAQRRVSQLQAVKLYAQSYQANPTDNGLRDLGVSIRELISAARERGETQIDPEQVPLDGITRIRNDILGNSERSREMWHYNEDGTAHILMPIVLSGKTRITNNIDKTPFMQQHRMVRFTLRNVDEDDGQAFAAHMKSDVPLGGDGNRHVDDSVHIRDGSEILVEKAAGKDRAYYLAWRGQTMTKEEFKRRHPDAEVLLEVLP